MIGTRRRMANSQTFVLGRYNTYCFASPIKAELRTSTREWQFQPPHDLALPVPSPLHAVAPRPPEVGMRRRGQCSKNLPHAELGDSRCNLSSNHAILMCSFRLMIVRESLMVLPPCLTGCRIKHRRLARPPLDWSPTGDQLIDKKVHEGCRLSWRVD